MKARSSSPPPPIWRTSPITPETALLAGQGYFSSFNVPFYPSIFNVSGQWALVDDGMVVLHPDGFEVTPRGWYFVRSVAMLFDRHLQADKTRERFSKVI
mgnify:CR=1 FL=1